MNDYIKTINTIIKNLVDEGYTHIPGKDPIGGAKDFDMYFEKGDRRVFIEGYTFGYYQWNEDDPCYGNITGARIRIYAYFSHDRVSRWNSNGHILAKTILFYDMAGNATSGRWYTTDRDAALEANAKRKSRRDAKHGGNPRSVLGVNDVLFKAARSLKGFKNVKRDDLYVYRVVNRYKTYHFEKLSSNTWAEVKFYPGDRPYISTGR